MLNLPNQQNTPDDIGLKAEIKEIGCGGETDHTTDSSGDVFAATRD
jgi:hypothetical protein